MGLKLSLATAINVATILVGIGINYGMMKSQGNDFDRRLSGVEALQLDKMKWQTDRNTENIDKLTGDQRTTMMAVAQLNAKIDVMAEKITYIADALKPK